MSTRVIEARCTCPKMACHAVHSWSYYSRGRFPVFVCPECKSFVEVHTADPDTGYAYVGETGINLKMRVYEHYVTDTPQAVRNTLEEGFRCHAAGAWNGCAALARKTIEIIATDLGGQGYSLYAKLQDLKLRGIVAAHFVYWDHTIRNLGNTAVHYDPHEPAGCGFGEATCALAYAYEVSKRIYLQYHLDEPPPEKRFEHIAQDYRKCLLDPNWFSIYGINSLIQRGETDVAN